MTTAPQPRRRIGFKRWIVLGLIVLGGYLAFGVGGIFKPVSPVVVLPGEPIWPGVPITNTLLSTLIADAILIAIALFSVQGFMRSRKQVPSGFYNFFEFIVEFLWNATESAAGKWARRMFPWVATIFLLVLSANMIRVIPGMETIGWMKEGHGHGYAPVHLFGNVYAIDGSHEVEAEEHGDDSHSQASAHSVASASAAHAAAAAAAEEAEPCHACEVVPFLRGAATDLNFTFALAVIAVVMSEVFGVWALGVRYFGKFINTSTMISKPFFGVIDFGVGLLELVSELSRVLSFSFRLFGNIFAGALLLSILGALTAIVVPSLIYTLEIFVGIIQAYVFAMLALVFMSQATVSHHGDEHGEHPAEEAHVEEAHAAPAAAH